MNCESQIFDFKIEQDRSATGQTRRFFCSLMTQLVASEPTCGWIWINAIINLSPNLPLGS